MKSRNTLLAIIVQLTCSFVSNTLLANEYPCGEYEAKAKITMKEGFATVSIFPESKSQLTFSLHDKEAPKLSPYIGGFVSLNFYIHEPMDATIGKISELSKIQRILPDPLSNNSGTMIKLLKSTPCKK